MKIDGRTFLLIGTLLSGLGVALGAVGAHALRATLEANSRVDTFETAVKYHVYHGLALLLIGILCYMLKDLDFTIPGLLIFIGVIFFSGSLYLLCLTSMKWVVYITPIGGMLMIGGWLFLVIRLLSAPK